MKLIIMPAVAEDCRMLWEWRNDGETRKMSFSSEFIPYEKHEEWFKNALQNPNRKVLIICDENEKIGMIRFDISGEEAEININISPNKRGMGYGTVALAETCEYAFRNFGISKVVAKIKPENVASIKSFSKAGFEIVDEKGMVMVLRRKNLFEQLVEKAKKHPKRIGFPEAEDERIILAADRMMSSGTAIPVLIGEYTSIIKQIEKLGVKNDFEIIDLNDSRQGFAERLFELRKEKGMSIEEAKRLVSSPIYFSAVLLETGRIDAVIAGADIGTADSIRPFLQIIKPEEGIKKVSSSFVMFNDDKAYLFADCSIIIDPNSEELANIAIATAETALWLGIMPKIAMLSFSTKGSASHIFVDKIAVATETLRKKRPDLDVEGEIQVDAAIVPEVAAKKCRNSIVQGDANILIFPDLNSGNIAYKLVERLGGYTAIGPIIQGLPKRVNLLSRGCSVNDIMLISALTSVQVQASEAREG